MRRWEHACALQVGTRINQSANFNQATSFVSCVLSTLLHSTAQISATFTGKITEHPESIKSYYLFENIRNLVLYIHKEKAAKGRLAGNFIVIVAASTAEK